MHAEARGFVAFAVTQIPPPRSVLEIGGRNVNGTIRDLFAGADYVALDVAPGDGVDIVADAATWTPDSERDCVVCCEVFEHTPDWPRIVRTTAAAVRVGGHAIVTAAAPPRAPHSAVDGGPLQAGEWYANIDPQSLAREMAAAGFNGKVATDPEHGDVYVLAERVR